MTETKYMDGDRDINTAMSAIMHALSAYYQMAHSINETLEKDHGPIWWTQLLILGAIEGARTSADDGKLDAVLADNLTQIIAAAREGRPLFKRVNKKDAPEIQPTHSGTERVQ